MCTLFPILTSCRSKLHKNSRNKECKGDLRQTWDKRGDSGSSIICVASEDQFSGWSARHGVSSVVRGYTWTRQLVYLCMINTYKATTRLYTSTTQLFSISLLHVSIPPLRCTTLYLCYSALNLYNCALCQKPLRRRHLQLIGSFRNTMGRDTRAVSAPKGCPRKVVAVVLQLMVSLVLCLLCCVAESRCAPVLPSSGLRANTTATTTPDLPTTAPSRHANTTSTTTPGFPTSPRGLLTTLGLSRNTDSLPSFESQSHDTHSEAGECCRVYGKSSL